MVEITVETYDELEPVKVGKKRTLVGGFSKRYKSRKSLENEDLYYMAALIINRPAELADELSYALSDARISGMGDRPNLSEIVDKKLPAEMSDLLQRLETAMLERAWLQGNKRLVNQILRRVS